MSKCANCEYDAQHVYTITENVKIYYCARHLPRALSKPGTPGVSMIPPVVESKSKARRIAATEPVVEAPVVEEPIVEAPVVEEAPAEEPVTPE